MSDSTNWKSFESLTGWTVIDDYGEVKEAHLKRHPQHWSYTPIGEDKPLTRAESEAYSALNEKLHEELRRVSKEHFANTPVPKELQPEDDPWFTPFTYQNYDWYGPSYECYIQVIGKYIDAKILARFQSLLVDDHRDWCIQVALAETDSIEDGHVIAVFSNQVIIHEDAATFLGVPTEQ